MVDKPKTPTVPPGGVPELPPSKEPAVAPEQNPSVKEPEAQPPSEFAQAAEGIQQILSTMPKGGTAKMRLTYWLIGLAISAIAGMTYPVATALSSYADKKAERETATAKQRADADASKAKMQADLLKRIIAVADKATIKDPTSIFQLGLIAQMVNENHKAFGIKLVDAERTMKRMFDSLAPVSGLRRRLAESNRLLGRINRKVARAKLGVQRTERIIKSLRAKQQKATTKWQRQHYQKAITEQEHYQDHHDLQLQFYELKAKREKSHQQYFQGELEQQEAALTRRLQQTTLLRNKMKDRTARFSYLLTKLRSRSKVTQQVASELRGVMVEVEASTEQAQQDIKRLKLELKSEQNALDSAKRTLKRVRKKLRWYKQNQIVTMPSGLPFSLPFACPASPAAPQTKARRTLRRKKTRRPLGGAAYYRRPPQRAAVVRVVGPMRRRATRSTMGRPMAAPRRAPRRRTVRRFHRRRNLQGLFNAE